MKEAKRRPGRPSKQDQFQKELLLSHALIEFAKHGYEGASLRKIANLSNVDVALLSYHFGSKLGLWTSVVDHLTERITLQTVPFKNNYMHMKLETACIALVDNIVNFCFEFPFHMMFVTNELSHQSERSIYLMDKMLLPTFRHLMPFIKDCMEAGVIKKQEPTLYYLMLVNSVSLLGTIPNLVNEFKEDFTVNNDLKSEMKESVLANFFQIAAV
ncbi:transcriptional regulator, TetR family [Paenibacillus algorifonticola]|uniref:Transcriptional regulator, TetR family n=1 Tax=Paenibacillus algorifonticola TaxID=684063 RepID=A0A1I2D5F1_9BACL|nr:TetR/AcrR family transcriptional regulator [Paenibacillus algorifonticola]SFE75293.1 transcriptional regulator, TetR family [Paenibacillus algorifonticola]